jgi:hypothetical protein
MINFRKLMSFIFNEITDIFVPNIYMPLLIFPMSIYY